ncbi:hypothetical protein GW17_00001536 [Ensete ventricosum]|nr:hypothetical protein GW17_00001536 [Ensete ventricosum]
MLKHNTSAEKIFVKVERSMNLSLYVKYRFATCIPNCEKETLVSDSAVGLAAQCVDENPFDAFNSMHDRSIESEQTSLAKIDFVIYIQVLHGLNSHSFCD